MEKMGQSGEAPVFTFDMFRAYMAAGKAQGNGNGNWKQAFHAMVMVLPISGAQLGKPFLTHIVEASGLGICLEVDHPFQPGDRFCIRLPRCSYEAAWVECETTACIPKDGSGYRLEGHYLKTSCPYACGCPAFFFLRYGEQVNCPYAGHAGCMQSGPAGEQVKALLALGK